MQNAERLGIERFTRCAESHSPSSEADVDLHYCVLPTAAAPEHAPSLEQAMTANEPFVELREMHLHIFWRKASNGCADEATTVGSGYSKCQLSAMCQQLRSAMRRTLRLQFIR